MTDLYMEHAQREIDLGATDQTFCAWLREFFGINTTVGSGVFNFYRYYAWERYLDLLEESAKAQRDKYKDLQRMCGNN